MTWTTTNTLKVWNFICLDQDSLPVAKFSANIWAVQTLGEIELLGPKAGDMEAREEIVVMALTLYYCMLLRMNNVFNLAGAVFHKGGPIKQAE